MNIFKKVFKGVPLGTIYPVQYEPGHQCPPELLEQATAAGVLENLNQDAPSNPPPDSQDKQSDDQAKGDSESSDETQKTSKKAKNGKAPEDNQDAPAT